MGDLTAHFDSSEFLSGGVDRRDPPCRLLGVLEAIRAIAGKPLPIVSGYRTVSRNAEVGGAPNSFHLTAEAADIPPGFVREPDARRAGAGGCGIGDDGWVVHVDIGPDRTWVY